MEMSMIQLKGLQSAFILRLHVTFGLQAAVCVLRLSFTLTAKRVLPL